MIKRIKPRLDITVDAEVKKILEDRAKDKHLKVSQYINQVLWEYITSNGFDKKNHK